MQFELLRTLQEHNSEKPRHFLPDWGGMTGICLTDHVAGATAGGDEMNEL